MLLNKQQQKKYINTFKASCRGQQSSFQNTTENGRFSNKGNKEKSDDKKKETRKYNIIIIIINYYYCMKQKTKHIIHY